MSEMADYNACEITYYENKAAVDGLEYVIITLKKELNILNMTLNCKTRQLEIQKFPFNIIENSFPEEYYALATLKDLIEELESKQKKAKLEMGTYAAEMSRISNEITSI